MDIVQTTTNSGLLRPSRDHSAPRRAYLDTYAKRRAGVPVQGQNVSTQSAKAPVAAPQQHKVLAQVPTTKLAMQKSNGIEQTPSMQQAPVGGMLTYDAQQPIKTQERPKPVIQDISPAHQDYINELSQRNHAAIMTAPAAEETVTDTGLSAETEAYFEDPAAEAQIGANLDALYSGSLTDMIAKNNNASASHIRTIVVSALACGVISVGMFSLFARYNSPPVIAQPIGSPVIEVESSNTQQPVGTAAAKAVAGPVNADPSHPVNLLISGIGVNAPVQGLGTTPEGLIDVPKAYGVVGWYNKGSIPGQAGPAVLVGHYAGGNGAVFDKLGDLKEGDLITTTNGRGQSFTYRVTVKNEYEKDKVPMAQIFKASNESRLEIITCAGKWQANTYNNRLVITAELVK